MFAVIQYQISKMTITDVSVYFCSRVAIKMSKVLFHSRFYEHSWIGFALKFY